jgi:hypothetical protein
VQHIAKNVTEVLFRMCKVDVVLLLAHNRTLRERPRELEISLIHADLLAEERHIEGHRDTASRNTLTLNSRERADDGLMSLMQKEANCHYTD